MTDYKKITLTFEVDVFLNDTPVEIIEENLRYAAKEIVGNACVTGDSPAEVDFYTIEVASEDLQEDWRDRSFRLTLKSLQEYNPEICEFDVQGDEVVLLDCTGANIDSISLDDYETNYFVDVGSDETGVAGN
jgi:hypothetical protein